MDRRWQALGGLLLVALLGPATPISAQAALGTSASLLDTLEVVDLEGRTWNRSTLAGQVVLVDFWATWCAPCLAQFPKLEALYGQHHAKGFEILAVALDSKSNRALRSWLRRRELPWPQIHRPQGFADPLAQQFAVDAIPRSFLFDRAGRLVAVDLDPQALAATVGVLLRSGAPEESLGAGVAEE